MEITKGPFRSKIAYLYKVVFDGKDLISRHEGEWALTKNLQKYIEERFVNLTYQQAEQIYQYSISNLQKYKKLDLPKELIDKYQIGYVKIKDLLANLKIETQIPFLSEQAIQDWNSLGLAIEEAEFLVAPSYDKKNKLNGIAMRILNEELVDKGFKWIFPAGQDCTFNLQNTSYNQPLYVVEGFKDMIALKESGYTNVVGLGSINLSIKQKSLLRKFKKIYVFDMDEFGLKIMSRKRRFSFYTQSAKDPYDAYTKYGKVSLLAVE